MSSAPHSPHRNTVSVTELRRVLANADAALAASTHHPPPPTRAIPTAAQAFVPVPTSPTRSPASSVATSPFGSPAQSPVAQLPPPPFDVRAAAETCRRKTGYVSFMDVDGLGAPAGAACDDEVDGPPPGALRERSWSWSQLLGIAPGVTMPPTKFRTRDAPPPSAYTKRV